MKSETTEPADLSVSDFRRHLQRAGEWILEYRSKIPNRCIWPDVEPGTIQSQLGNQIPDEPEDLEIIFRDFEELIVPGLLHWGHPKFAGYFGSTTNAPGILGECLSAALNVSTMTWRTSPAATELETVMLQWIRTMLKLPEEWTGIVYDTASVSTMHALTAAREHAFPGSASDGLTGRQTGIIYQSAQAHSSIAKAAAAIGIGKNNVRKVEVDDNFRMIPEKLNHLIEADIRHGLKPAAIVATIGTTSTASVDPVAQIGSIAKRHNIWLHIDAAYGGAYSILREGEWVQSGVEAADSYVINPHKWLYVPLDFSALYLKSPELLRGIFSIVPEYLKGDTRSDSINYMDYGIQLGRRFRALKAWFVFRAFGKSGLQMRIKQNCRHAELFASQITKSNLFELAAPVSMGVVCFRLKQNEGTSIDLNEPLLEKINRSGELFLTATELNGSKVLRAAFGNILTTDQDVIEMWQSIQLEAGNLLRNQI